MDESITIINGTEPVNSGICHGGILNPDVESGDFFNAFVENQKTKGVTANGAVN